jgi:hypothetical protein
VFTLICTCVRLQRVQHVTVVCAQLFLEYRLTLKHLHFVHVIALHQLLLHELRLNTAHLVLHL